LPHKDEDVDVGPHLGALLRQLQVGRSEVLVGIGRTNIELRKLQLPPAPDEDLPDMVRFQAMRQFTTIAEDWPLDFVPLQKNESGLEVLAAALSPTVVQQIRTTCTSLELTPKCLVLRPFAAASLLTRARPADSRCSLVVDVLATEADLFVLSDGKVAFLRTVRLPDAEYGGPALVAALVGEVRRTIGAAQSQMSGRRIESIVVFANQDRHTELRATMSNQLSLPVDTVDPFSTVKVSGDIERRLPDEPGRFAPLLGMMLDEAAEAGHGIDFLHPRKRPEPKTQRTRNLAIAAAAVAVLCLFFGGIQWLLYQKDQEIKQLNESVTSMKKNVDVATKNERDLAELEKFMSGNIDWLSEFARLSSGAPPSKDFLINSVTVSVQENGGANVRIDGLVKSRDHLSQIENRLRQKGHRVISGDFLQDNTHPGYPWKFSQTLIIEPVKPAPRQSTQVVTQPASEKSPSDHVESPATDTPASENKVGTNS